MSTPDPIETPEARKARGKRNLAIAGGLIAFIVIVYLTTILKMSGNAGVGP